MKALVHLHQSRARDFLEGVRLMREDPGFRQSAALLAIHSAISFSDALRLSLDDAPTRLREHSEASRELRRLLRPANHVDERGLLHLEYLIAKKDFVAYGNHRLDESVFAKIMTSAERFTAWVRAASRELRLEGWNTDEERTS